ncbi:MAG: YheC/YheD family protein [Alicyclobacillaceae bacterium]|nr:YheC/YheD family protein [Alicyclobacillaceae bacterium]
MNLAILLWEKNGRPIGNLPLCSELLQTGRKMGADVSVVTPHGLLRAHPYAFVLRKGIWRRRPFEGADAVYNRISLRKWEQTPRFHGTVRMLKEQNIPVWNPGFFAKDDLIRSWTASDAVLSRHVPETVAWTGKETAPPFSSGAWALKPCDGRAGEGIVKIVRTSGEYRWWWQGRGKSGEGRGDWNTCLSFLRRWTQGRRFLCQRWIQTARWKGCPFDFRLLFQKDATGRWVLRGTGARAAGRRRMTTHVPWGGRVVDGESAVKEVFGLQAPEVFESALRVARMAVETVDARYGGRTGEMSVDLACDRSGFPWLFEANAKPMRFDEPHIHRSYLHGVFETARWTATFTGCERPATSSPPESPRPTAVSERRHSIRG